MIRSIVVGYLIGSIPSADGIARLRGHDLRASGTGNPGTANALRVGGRLTATIVLLVDLAKGAAAALAGDGFAGVGGSIAGGVFAIAGQVLSPWYRFKGGKGLGVTGGVTAVVWPPGLLVTLPLIAISAKVLRAAGGALVGLAVYLTGTVIWAANGWSTWWGVPPDDRLVWCGLGVVLLTAPKFIGDLSRRRYES